MQDYHHGALYKCTIKLHVIEGHTLHNRTYCMYGMQPHKKEQLAQYPA